MNPNPFAMPRFLLLFLVSLVSFSLATAQQSGSSKTKGKNRFYEKTGGKGIQVSNAATINTTNLDFSPTYYGNGLVFVSSRKKGGFVDPGTGESYFELYYSRLDPNGEPVDAEPFSGQLNSQLHEGPVSFNRAGDRIYFTASNQQGGTYQPDSTGRVRLKIYTAERGSQEWTNIQELPINDDHFSTMHPSLSQDGKRLYFSSNRPGGQGGMDLWYVDRTDQGWGEPVNLGPKVNSFKNEVFPYIHYTGYLFFSSDGLEDGMGGLDIYALNTDELEKNTPMPMGPPFNSGHDDLGFVVDASGHQGFFASDRPGGAGKDDIYSYTSESSLVGDASAFVLRTAFQVTDASTGSPIADVAVFALPLDPQGKVSGDVLYDLKVRREAALHTYTLDLTRKTSLTEGEPTAVSDANGMALAQLALNREYLVILEKPGYEVMEMPLTVGGTPGADLRDVALTPKTCYSLSGRVMNQKSGLPMARVPVVIEGPSGRPIRLESDGNGLFQTCLPETGDYALSASREGYIPGRTRISTEDGDVATLRKAELLLLPFSNTPDSRPPEALNTGSVIVLENLYYDYNQVTLQPGASQELDVVYDLMREHPAMTVELIAHTDSRGEAAYNQKLSEARARSAKNYLVSRGIQPVRITAIGKGESQLRNGCTDDVRCAERDHAYNRRTEIRITNLDTAIEIRYAD